MMIEVKSFAGMRQYTSHLAPDGKLEVADGTTVGQVLGRLGVPPDAGRVILVNGRQRSPEHVLESGDTLVFFPPMEGG